MEQCAPVLNLQKHREIRVQMHPRARGTPINRELMNRYGFKDSTY